MEHGENIVTHKKMRFLKQEIGVSLLQLVRDAFEELGFDANVDDVCEWVKKNCPQADVSRRSIVSTMGMVRSRADSSFTSRLVKLKSVIQSQGGVEQTLKSLENIKRLLRIAGSFPTLCNNLKLIKDLDKEEQKDGRGPENDSKNIKELMSIAEAVPGMRKILEKENEDGR